MNNVNDQTQQGQDNRQQQQSNGYQPSQQSACPPPQQQQTVPQQPPQQGYGYQQPPQQPYGYQQQSQQGYGYQQPPQQPYGYQQQPQQAYGYQQPPYGYQQPPQYQAPVGYPLSPAEKDAFFSTAGSIFMLIFAIVSTFSLISSFLSFNISELLFSPLSILMVIGTWITFANAKKQKLATNGINLIKTPYKIKFVFTVIGFVVNIIVWLITFNIVSLLTGILSFVFTAICYSSVNKTLNVAKEINLNHSVRGQKTGSFAAIVMIISGLIELISTIVGQLTLMAIKEMLENSFLSFLAPILGTASTSVYIIAAISFISQISGAIVILKFGKKLKAVNG